MTFEHKDIKNTLKSNFGDFAPANPEEDEEQRTPFAPILNTPAPTPTSSNGTGGGGGGRDPREPMIDPVPQQ